MYLFSTAMPRILGLNTTSFGFVDHVFIVLRGFDTRQSANIGVLFPALSLSPCLSMTSVRSPGTPFVLFEDNLSLSLEPSTPQ